jgi:uncharacterized membrane protein YgcG
LKKEIKESRLRKYLAVAGSCHGQIFLLLLCIIDKLRIFAAIINIKNMFRNIKKKSIALLACIAIIAGVSTCSRDDPDDGSEISPSSYDRKVRAAKQWYEDNYPSTFSIKNSEGDVYPLMRPNWDDAFKKSDKWEETVETGLFVRGWVSFAMPENKLKAEETGDERYGWSFTRLIIKTAKRTKQTDAFLMTVMPSVEYLERTNFEPYREMAYIGRDKHFSGCVIYHNMDGIFVNGWVYENGKPVKHLGGDNDRLSLRIRRLSACGTVTNYETTLTCDTWYYTVNGGAPQYSHTSCTTSTTYSSSSSACNNNFGSSVMENSSSGGGSGGYSGGGGSIGDDEYIDISKNPLLLKQGQSKKAIFYTKQGQRVQINFNPKEGATAKADATILDGSHVFKHSFDCTKTNEKEPCHYMIDNAEREFVTITINCTMGQADLSVVYF